jgi:hypothetical protein
MKFKTVCAIALVLAATLVPRQVHAQKKVAGAVLVASGAALMLGAFNYDNSCPRGYSTHTYENLSTQCVYISSRPPYNSDVTSETTTITYQRPALLWSGVGAAAAGVVLMLLPTRAAEVAPSVGVTPTGVSASKTFRF